MVDNEDAMDSVPLLPVSADDDTKTMLMASRRSCRKRGACRQRWRTVATVVVATAFTLLTLSVWWRPESVDAAASVPKPVPTTNAATLRRILTDGEADTAGAGSWSCGPANASSGCRLTPAVLAATSAARPTVYRRTGLDCLAMFGGHSSEIEAARTLMERERVQTMMSDAELRLLAADCAAFKRTRGYFTQPLSQAEADFPIAYSILAYDNIPQVFASLSSNYFTLSI